MMKMEILEEFSSSNDPTIVKGRRTKRPRLSSSTSSSGGGAVGGGFHHSLASCSPTTSSGVSISTEEDEDMANCLILLARGSFPPQEVKAADNKFRTRKSTDMTTAVAAVAGKVGISVHACKACNRTFPSFQALGGHRASHKMRKPAADTDRKKSPPAAPDGPGDEGQFARPMNTIPPPPSTLLANKICHTNHQGKSKFHECSVCGSEFASGQALGGHMRRHRTAPSTAARIGASAGNDWTSSDVGEKPSKTLALDLNQPASPEEEDKFHQFPSKQQQPHRVFSAAALMDCHN